MCGWQSTPTNVFKQCRLLSGNSVNQIQKRVSHSCNYTRIELSMYIYIPTHNQAEFKLDLVEKLGAWHCAIVFSVSNQNSLLDIISVSGSDNILSNLDCQRHFAHSTAGNRLWEKMFVVVVIINSEVRDLWITIAPERQSVCIFLLFRQLEGPVDLRKHQECRRIIMNILAEKGESKYSRSW